MCHCVPSSLTHCVLGVGTLEAVDAGMSLEVRGLSGSSGWLRQLGKCKARALCVCAGGKTCPALPFAALHPHFPWIKQGLGLCSGEQHLWLGFRRERL